MSYAKIQVLKNEQVRADILGFTGMDMGEYMAWCFELGCEWAERHATRADGADYLKSQPVYWGWWRCEWARLSELWIDTMLQADAYDGVWVWIRTEDNKFKMLKTEAELTSHYKVFMQIRMRDCQCQRAVMEGSFHRGVIKR